MPYAYCLAPVVWSCYLMSSVVLKVLCSSACPQAFSLFQLCLSEDWGFWQPLVSRVFFALHPGIAFLGYVHHEIACLAS